MPLSNLHHLLPPMGIYGSGSALKDAIMEKKLLNNHYFMRSRVLDFDFETLPQPPFSIYFLNDNGEISPKRAFTVLEKRVNHKKQVIELKIMEKEGQYVEYNNVLTERVHNYFHVN